MMQVREERIVRTMEQTGMGRMQAINFERGRNIVHARLRENPRAFDHRFINCEPDPEFDARLRAVALANLGLDA
jgi:hypothetical protein